MRGGRFVELTILAVVAVVAIGAQLDQQSTVSPALTSVVPLPFRSFAQQDLTEAAVAQGSPAEAMAQALRLVERRPIPAESLYLLAAAQQRTGRIEKSLRTAQFSGRRGWRLAPAQDIMIRFAFAAGDNREAANRIAALWATGSDEVMRDGWTGVLLEASGGPKAFAVPLVAAESWRSRFPSVALRIAPAHRVADTIDYAASLGAKFDCHELSGAARSLAMRGLPDVADRMWRRPCANQTAPIPGLIAFDRASSDAPGPFGWAFQDPPGVSYTLKSWQSGNVLEYDNDGFMTRLLAIGIFRIRPGTYRLSMDEREATGLTQVTAVCLDKSARPRQIAAIAGNGSMPLIVPQTGCPTIRFDLRVAGGRSRGVQLTLK